MLKVLQRITIFNISKFQAAAKAMKESGKQPWIEKISKNEQNQLWALYKQATEGDMKEEMNKLKMNQKEIDANRTQQTKKQTSSKIQHDQDQYEAWSKYKGKSKEEAENEYVKVARDLLTKHKAEKFIKDF